MVLVKNLKFCEHFVLCKIHPKKVFSDFLVRKQAFLDSVNMDFKRRQNSKLAVRGGDKGLQGVKKDYKNFFLTRTFPDTSSWSIFHKNQS